MFDVVTSEDPRVIRTRKDVLAAAMNILISDGWGAVTHARVAKQSGYSRATIYAHWPRPLDLISDAFRQFQEIPHHEKSGDPKTDLRGEVMSFSRAMVEHRLDRVLASLVEHAQTTPEVVEIRQSFVAAGEAPMRETLPSLASGSEREAVVLMLCGMVSHSVLMHGKPPSKAAVNSAVDIVLRGLEKG
jgi:AcrR family transcriptional regulator